VKSDFKEVIGNRLTVLVVRPDTGIMTVSREDMLIQAQQKAVYK